MSRRIQRSPKNHRRGRFSHRSCRYTDSLFKTYCLGYALNLVDHVVLDDEKALTCFFGLMDSHNRNACIEEIYRPREASKEIPCDSNDNYEYLIKHIDSIDRIASSIFEDYIGRLIRLDDRSIVAIIKKYLKIEHSSFSHVQSDFEHRLSDLQKTFLLGDDEITLLKFLYLVYETNYDGISDMFQNINFSGFIRATSIMTGLSEKAVRQCLNLHGRLYSSCIIETIDHKRNSFTEIDESVSEYLAGLSDISLLEKYVSPDSKNAFSLSDFHVPEDRVSLSVSLIQSGRPCNILLYGMSGTGKTEFARSLVKSTGRSCYFLQYGEEKKSRQNPGNRFSENRRALALKVAIRAVEQNGGVLIVDEADFLLNTQSFSFNAPGPIEKGLLNNLLETSQASIIWISNNIGMMEYSTLRRFSYSLYFDRLVPEQRRSIWKNQLRGNKLRSHIPNALIDKLSHEYNVDAGGIASALSSLEVVLQTKEINLPDVEKILRSVLSRHEALLTGNHREQRKKNESDPVSSSYDVSALNLDADVTTIVSAVKSMAEMMKFGTVKTGMNLLFWGVPGTGKTEFARYLSRESGLKLILKRYSDLESKWVGETEQNIAAAFREAENTKAILFIDEADSFFTSRETAFRSWEVSRTNEFLTWMEGHGCILICCTNLLPSLDRAALRRFHWKTEFRPLKPEAKLVLYKKFFSLRGKKLTSNQREIILALPGLTPGDIYAVHQRMAFVSDTDLNHDRIIDELVKETKYKETHAREIGF